MGVFDLDGASVASRRSSGHHLSAKRSRDKDRGRSRDRSRDHSRDRSRDRSHDRSRVRHTTAARSFLGIDAGAVGTSGGLPARHRSASRARAAHTRASANYFGLPNVSSRSLFSAFGSGSGGRGHGHAASYYRRAPRANFVQRSYKKLKRLLRDLLYYAKKHPLRVFLLAIMPLITGGALTALLARFGLRLPPALERMIGHGARAVSGADGIAGLTSIAGVSGLVGDAVRMAGASASAYARPGSSGTTSSAVRTRDVTLRDRRSQTPRDYFAAGADYYARRETRSSTAGDGWAASISRFFSS